MATLLGSHAVVADGLLTKQELDRLLAAYENHLKTSDPVSAGKGDDRAALRRWPDTSPAAIAARIIRLEALRDALAQPVDNLDDAEQLNQRLLSEQVETELAGYAFDEARLAFRSGEGFFTLAETTAATTAIRDERDADAWIDRLQALPEYFEIELANLRRGIETGFVQPRLTTLTALDVLNTLAAEPPEHSALLLPFKTAATMPRSELSRWQARATAIIRDQIRPAQAKLATFIADEYLLASRQTIGISSVPSGPQYYEFLIRRNTTTKLSPDEIHDIGLSEIARISIELDKIVAATGFEGSLREFIDFLRNEPRFHSNDADEYLARTSEILKRADYLLPRWFGRLPRLSYGVILKPKGLDSISSGYLPGSPEQGVAGAVILTMQGSNQNPRYSLPAWALHEGVPGHHLQIALAQERSDLPGFRRSEGLTVYVEGWALYAERLGEEMGLYRDAYERFGQLSMEMWRACRLIMDTGIHWRGWTYDEAESCLRDRTGLAPVSVVGETKRYIGWPGQALAYKIGELEILRLRRRAQSELGEHFDIRAFHDLILVDGPMPLAVIAERVENWINNPGG